MDSVKSICGADQRCWTLTYVWLWNCWCKHNYSKANFNMPLATWVVGDTLLFALCCDHFMHNSWVFILLLYDNREKEMDIYIHTYIISAYTYICICLRYISNAGNSWCHKMQPACMQKFIAGPSSASIGVEGPWYVSTAPSLMLLHCWVQHPVLQQQEKMVWEASLCLEHIFVPFAKAVKLCKMSAEKWK